MPPKSSLKRINKRLCSSKLGTLVKSYLSLACGDLIGRPAVKLSALGIRLAAISGQLCAHANSADKRDPA